MKVVFIPELRNASLSNAVILKVPNVKVNYSYVNHIKESLDMAL